VKLIDGRKNPKYIILKSPWTRIACHLFLVALPTMILMNSCATKDIVREWSPSEDHEQKLGKIMIMGLVNQVSLRNDVEYEMADAAHKFGLKATNSMAMFPPELGKPFEDAEKLRFRLQERGFDAIITVAIIDIEAERYVGPEKQYVPLVYYNRFGNYYHRTEVLVYKPGYFSLKTRYFLETNIYELKAGRLVWSGRSTVFDPQDVERFVPRYSKNLFKELQKTGIIAD
jgi:hypothetical protein